jgi:polyhydroxyalkanoate synthesis regulator phasin
MDTNPEMKKEKDIHYYSFIDVAHRIMLAGIGALSISMSEMEEFINRLVERGEIAKKDGENMINEFRERRHKFMNNDESYFQKRMDKFYNKMNMPSRSDIDELSEKIMELEKKIDELVTSQNSTNPTNPPEGL